MVKIQSNIIELHTRRTSMVLSAGRNGLLENLYYGRRIHVADAAVLQVKADAGYGGEIKRRDGEVSLSVLRLELSPALRGDYRRGALLAENRSGDTVSDFSVSGFRQQKAPAPAGGMPHGRGGDEVVCVSFAEPTGISVELYYTIFYEADVITKKMRITNDGDGPLRLLRALSAQTDLPRGNYRLANLTGAWARENDLTETPLSRGIKLFGSNYGVSGAKCNPFFFLAEECATETTGDVYGFNLIYSGSHEGGVEVDPFGRTRVLQGLSSEGFSWPLAPGESFLTPEAVLTFSAAGKTGMSHNMHRFVLGHIIPPQWNNTERPVLVNNWEGTYFDFNESKILAMAKVAAKVGVELFVLDDGWFGRRNSDEAGLGDYDVNRKKLPSGIVGLCEKLKKMGLQFGLWFEPEMVNADSYLYEQHPDWAVAAPGHAPCVGRHQLALDICRAEVRDYIVDSMGRVLDSCDIRYVKWDMNRNLADCHSPALSDQGMFMHSYILGLYDLFARICATRPEILFEGCASGGNRFDLGVLYYMPQIWTSDGTDAYRRAFTQTGASYGYPQSTMGCHVSAAPNHQTLRVTPFETRFNTAVFGVLGYELDMRTLSHFEKTDMEKQIAYYKEHRKLLQFGEYYRVKTPEIGKGYCVMVVSADKKEAIVGDFLGLLETNSEAPPLKMRGLLPDMLYKGETRAQKVTIDTFGGLINHVLPVHLNPDGVLLKAAREVKRLDTEKETFTAYGDLLCAAGVERLQAFSGAGYSENMRLLYDFASRLYYLKAQT